MSDLRKSFKERVIVPYNKYNSTQYKLGEIVAINKDKESCTVIYKNNKGVLVEAQDIPVKKSISRWFVGGFPSVGEKVELEETNNTVRIISIIDRSDIKAYTNTADSSSGTSSTGGYIGI